MNWFNENKQILNALFQGGFTFLFLSALLIYVVNNFDFSAMPIGTLAFILALVCIVFVSKTIYQIGASAVLTKRRAESLAKEMLKSSEQLFTEVYSNSPVAYLIVNESGVIESVNRSATRLFGQVKENLITQNLFTVIGHENAEHQAVLKQKFELDIVIADEEVKIIRQDSFSWAQVSMFPFAGYAGEKLNLVTLVDITKQKEIDTAKSEFVSLASHQLRTPISGMRWSAELLLRDEEDSLSEKQRHHVERLLSSIHRMSKLVDDFLQVSRFELGTRVLKAEPIILKELFDDITAEQHTLVTKKNLTIVKEYDSALEQINTDEGLLRMIVTNLYTNAVKYSREGGEVLVAYRLKGEELEIEVKDTGMGIPPEEQSRIFSKIFRASNAIKEVPDGTGLGLYIVKKSVEKLQGRASFLSAQEVGTSFVVVIPLVT